MTHVLLVGVSHHSAPVDVREQLDFHRRGLDGALDRLVEHAGVSEAVVLSTCNRAEVYVGCANIEDARRDVTRFLADFNELPPELLQPHLYTQSDHSAARHLYRVAAGLDSLVVGEPQILGQVKQAYGDASDRARTGALLNRLFHTAFSVGKRVRTETGLGSGAVSVSYAAISLARKIFGSLDGLHALLVGAGEMGKLTAQHLRAQSVARIVVTSRTHSHGQALADEIGAEAVPWGELQSQLSKADIVITATGATTPVVSRKDIEAAMKGRRYSPLFVIDIAVPRDVEAAAATVEHVFLYNIDDLRGIVEDNVARRHAEVQHADAIIDEEASAFAAWHQSRRAVPLVVALRKRFEDIRVAELERLSSKIDGLPPDARGRVEEITRLVVEKLLHAPTEQLKAAADPRTVEEYAETLGRLFDLGASPASDSLPTDRDGDRKPSDTRRNTSVRS